MTFCSVCGETLKEDEKEPTFNGKHICHDCRHEGMEAVQNKFKDLIRTGKDRKEAQAEASDEAGADEGETADSTQYADDQQERTREDTGSSEPDQGPGESGQQEHSADGDGSVEPPEQPQESSESSGYSYTAPAEDTATDTNEESKEQDASA